MKMKLFAGYIVLAVAITTETFPSDITQKSQGANLGAGSQHGAWVGSIRDAEMQSYTNFYFCPLPRNIASFREGWQDDLTRLQTAINTSTNSFVVQHLLDEFVLTSNRVEYTLAPYEILLATRWKRLMNEMSKPNPFPKPAGWSSHCPFEVVRSMLMRQTNRFTKTDFDTVQEALDGGGKWEAILKKGYPQSPQREDALTGGDKPSPVEFKLPKPD